MGVGTLREVFTTWPLRVLNLSRVIPALEDTIAYVTSGGLDTYLLLMSVQVGQHWLRYGL